VIVSHLLVIIIDLNLNVVCSNLTKKGIYCFKYPKNAASNVLKNKFLLTILFFN